MPALATHRTPPLKTIQNVAIEISRIYRMTKKGQLSTGDGFRMVSMLAILKQCLESCELERRLAELEDAVGKTGATVRPFPKLIS